MSQNLILIDALSSACWEKKGKIKKQLEGFFPRAGGCTCLAGCAVQDFHMALRCN
jgi:hypothetical protein